jgi:putative nucleotidyltransferase with HDIG domain
MSLPAVIPRAAERHISLSEVLSALSYALDLTEGQTPGHTLRSCVIGMRLGEALGLGVADRSALYYALLLKDAGCSSNASRMAALLAADDQRAKHLRKEIDWERQPQLIARLFPLMASGGSLIERCWQVVRLVAQPGAPREVVAIRCDRGAAIAHRLGFPDATSTAIRTLDEHWNGRGFPDGLRGEAIPLLGRITSLSQTVEVFHRRDGIAAAVAVARSRSGQWFDPELVDLFAAIAQDADWVQHIDGPGLGDRVSRLEPPDRALVVGADGLDAVAEAFADIIDAKSPYTYRHSTNVAALALAIGRQMNVGRAEERRLVRAGLLHDIGKLGVSNRILDKPGPMTPDERAAMERHPLFTAEVLERVGAFNEIVETAARHHERLDGTGYPWGLSGAQLDPAARILAVADVYEALTADRPYRAPLTREAALEIMGRDRGTRLCAVTMDALEASLPLQLRA